MLRKSTGENFKNILLVLIAILLAVVFFRDIIFNIDALVGDPGDSRLNNLFMEHWFRYFTGHDESIRNLPIFYGAKNVFGYSDTMFLAAIPYSVFRGLSVDWLTSDKLTLVLFSVIGGISSVVLLRKYLGADFFATVIGLIIMNFSNSLYNKIGHTQFINLCLVPLLFIFILQFYKSFSLDKKKQRLIWGSISITFFNLLIITSFYTGFFTALFLLFIHIAWIIYNISTKEYSMPLIKAFLLKNYKEIVFYTIVAIITITPFVLIYFPTFKEFGRRPWQEVLLSVPNLYDTFNISPTNLLWEATFGERPIELGYGYGFPIITIVLAVLAILKVTNKKLGGDIRTKEQKLCASIAIATNVFFFFIIKFHNFSLWYFVYNLVPSASSIRAVGRGLVFLHIPVGILIAIYLSNTKYTLSKSKMTLILSIICLLILGEHINTRNISGWKKSEVVAYLNEVSPPPKDCKIFVLEESRDIVAYNLQLDAWMIANKYNLKTINGYSGNSPKNWNLYGFNSITNDITFTWVNSHNLKNVYIYNKQTNTWKELQDNSNNINTINSLNSPDKLAAEYTQKQIKISNDVLTFDIDIKNLGQATWLRGSNSDKGEVHLGVRFYDKNGQELLDQRYGIGLTDVKTSESINVSQSIKIPMDKLDNIEYVSFGMVSELVTWFDQVGTKELKVPFKDISN